MNILKVIVKASHSLGWQTSFGIKRRKREEEGRVEEEDEEEGGGKKKKELEEEGQEWGKREICKNFQCFQKCLYSLGGQP